MISDVGVLQDFVTWSITGLARSAFMLIGITVALLPLNWQLALVTFAVMPLMILLTNYWRKRVRNAYRASRARLSLINGYLNESISGIRLTQSYTREALNFRHFDELNRSCFDANIQATTLTAMFFPGWAGTMNCSNSGATTTICTQCSGRSTTLRPRDVRLLTPGVGRPGRTTGP